MPAGSCRAIHAGSGLIAVVVVASLLLAIIRGAFTIAIALAATTPRATATRTVATATGWTIEATSGRSETTWTRSGSGSSSATTAIASAGRTRGIRTRCATTTGRTTGSASFTLASLVDPQLAAIELLAIEGGERLFGTFVRRHFDEREATGTSGLSVDDDRDASYFAPVCSKCFSE
jgi:hypothetical protein